jgi:hypothetical protein
MALLESYWKFKIGTKLSLRLYEKEYMTKNSKVIKSIIDLKVGTRFKIIWSNQDSPEHERTNDLQPLLWNFFITL